MNVVILTGNLGADIEVKTSGDTTYAHLSIATNFRVKKGDTWEKRVNWTRISALNGLAESLRGLGKGTLLLVEAHLETRLFERDGVRFHYSEVVADKIEFLRVKRADNGTDAEDPSTAGDDADEPSTDSDEDSPAADDDPRP